MKVLYVSSEVEPYAKTGGLADVSGALPPALAKLGVQITVVTPLYRRCLKAARDRPGLAIKPLGIDIEVPIAGRTVSGSLEEGRLPGGTRVVFIRQNAFFDREELYGKGKEDYADNCARFVFFARGALEAARALGIVPDVFHVHDWQTALIPVYLKVVREYCREFEDSRSLQTIHNIGYQGVFWHWDMPLTGLGWSHFNWAELEFYGKINLLKGGIVYADGVSTVSERYAREIQESEELGGGLDGVLRSRSRDVTGIVNGVDYSIWDPSVDEYIAVKYGPDDLHGKAACKKVLQEETGLPQKADVPLVGAIGRLTHQKGFDLLIEALPTLVRKNVQFVVLGTGDEKLEKAFAAASRKYRKKVAAIIGFDPSAAHRIEAGCDMFLMPSRYEPCGLNQLYSLRYGTVPVVRATGGLADTVVDAASEKAVTDGTATGFSFEGSRSTDLVSAVRRALKLYSNKHLWRKLVANGMKYDWSWKTSARKYVALYEKLSSSPRWDGVNVK